MLGRTWARRKRMDKAGLQDGPPKQFPAGRGAVSNSNVRFDTHGASPFNDGWEALSQNVGEFPRLETTLTRDSTRSAISWNTSRHWLRPRRQPLSWLWQTQVLQKAGIPEQTAERLGGCRIFG
jgi:hypothetical protein